MSRARGLLCGNALGQTSNSTRQMGPLVSGSSRFDYVMSILVILALARDTSAQLASTKLSLKNPFMGGVDYNRSMGFLRLTIGILHGPDDLLPRELCNNDANFMLELQYQRCYLGGPSTL